MRRSFFITSLMFLSWYGNAQTAFISKGKIEFERKTNTHRLYFSEEADSWSEQIKKLIPQFKTDYFDLVFGEDKSLYKPGKETEVKKTGFFESPSSENVVYKDFNQQTMLSQKQVFESQFLVSDSIKILQWKIEPETRVIAGFECHKAVTKICDSVVVVAFYADEIIPSNGPESFGGLPGMILGIAIPRLYTTWFATRIEIIDGNDVNKIIPPSKGKRGNEKELVSKINDGIKSWGVKYRDRALWFVTL